MARAAHASSFRLPAAREAATLRRGLLSWYARHRRPLPWRATRDPYAIWISEAMLQQTRVETAEAYWRRFMDALPTVADLAAADEPRVLALWSGLGYYRRARSLQAAARALMEHHGGQFPRRRAELLALPGIGPYTAGALLSIAFDLPEPLVDGNVARVLARLFALEDRLGSQALERRLWELAECLLPRKSGAGTWNQALMELGATVCTPRAPRCTQCPLQERCAAHAAGRVHELPRAKARLAPIDVSLTIARVEQGARVLLEQRPPGGRMAGLWQFPTREESGPDGSLSGLFPAAWAQPLALDAREPLGLLRHAITRHRIRARVHGARLAGPLEHDSGPLQWVPRARLPELALTGMARKVLALESDRTCRRPAKVR